MPPRLALEGVTPEPKPPKTHEWVQGGELEKIFKKYEHPLWKEQGELARKLGGHGGMDFIMNYRLVYTIRHGLPPDMDAYDAAAWSAPGPLSDISVAWDSMPLPFPDFTRGRWK